MTRTVILLILLYLVWRIAGLFGRRRRREYLRHQERMGVVELVRCERCGRYVSPAEVREEGRWPARRLVCAGGCERPAADGGFRASGSASGT